MKTFDYILLGLVLWQCVRVVNGVRSIPQWLPTDIKERVIFSVLRDQWPMGLAFLIIAYRVWG